MPTRYYAFNEGRKGIVGKQFGNSSKLRDQEPPLPLSPVLLLKFNAGAQRAGFLGGVNFLVAELYLKVCMIR